MDDNQDKKPEISLVDFQKAKDTINDYYAQDFTLQNGSDRPCICCDNKIKPYDPESTRFPQSAMYSKGIVDKISAGYGSHHDGDMFIIAICDTCMDRLKEEKRVQDAGNYMNLY